MDIQMNLAHLIKTYPDFPKKGVQFKDITPILANPSAYKQFFLKSLNWLEDKEIDLIAGIESRGFWFACPLATYLHVGFVPIRKAGKLPGRIISESYSSEYSKEKLQIQKSVSENSLKVLIVDDILATGNTALAAASLVEKTGDIVSGILFLGEITKLKGRKNLQRYKVHSLVKL